MPLAIVTGSGGLIGSESVRRFVESGFDVDRPRERHARPLLRPGGFDARTSRRAGRPLRRVPGARGSTSATPTVVRRVFAEHAARLELVVHAAAQPSHDWAASRAAHRLRRQRERHAEPARGDARHRARRDVRLHLDQQGLRRHAELPAARGPRAPPRAARGPPLRSTGSTPRCRSTARIHSLFGVSKAAADLLVQEYGRYFDMPTVCFRCGCLTGPAMPAPSSTASSPT